MDRNIIGLAGIKRSGKDTAALALTTAGYTRIAFADELRAEVFAQYHQASKIADEDKEVPQACLGGKSLRDVLIDLGMGRRAEDPDYWVKILRARILGLLAQGQRVCVTDVRLPNEFKMLRELGAFLIWIERPGILPGAHVTEQDHSALCDITVKNDATTEILRLKLGAVLMLIDAHSIPQQLAVEAA